jgi:transposase
MLIITTAYGAEFRRDDIDVARKGEAPVAQVAKDFGHSVTTLKRWMAIAQRKDSGAGPAAVEMRELKKRNRLLEQGNEILRRISRRTREQHARSTATKLPPRCSRNSRTATWHPGPQRLSLRADAIDSMDAGAIQCWALTHGWSGKNPERLPQYVRGVNAGKRPRTRSVTVGTTSTCRPGQGPWRLAQESLGTSAWPAAGVP